MRADLCRINVLERERILRRVRRVRIMADAKVVILRESKISKRHVAPFRVIAIDIVACFAQQRQGVPVRPPFSHPLSLQLIDASPAANEPVAQTVRVLVQNHRRVERAIPIRLGKGEDIHLDAPGGAVRSGSKIRVVHPGAVLRVGLDGVVAEAAAAEIVLLIIPRRFGETQFVQFVVHPIAPIKELHHRRVAIAVRRLGEVERKVKHAKRRALRPRQIGLIIGVAIQVRIDVVAARLILAIADPADRGSVGVRGG